MSGTHNKLLHGNNFNHWKFSDSDVDLNYISFSHPNPNPYPTHLPKHELPSPNNQFIGVFLCRILLCTYVRGVKSEFSLDTGYESKENAESCRSRIQHSGSWPLLRKFAWRWSNLQ